MKRSKYSLIFLTLCFIFLYSSTALAGCCLCRQKQGTCVPDLNRPGKYYCNAMDDIDNLDNWLPTGCFDGPFYEQAGFSLCGLLVTLNSEGAFPVRNGRVGNSCPNLGDTCFAANCDPSTPNTYCARKTITVGNNLVPTFMCIPYPQPTLPTIKPTIKPPLTNLKTSKY